MPANASHGVTGSRCLLHKGRWLLWLLGCSIVASAAHTVNVTAPQAAWKSVDLSKLEDNTAQAQQQLNDMLAWAIGACVYAQTLSVQIHDSAPL